MLNFNKYRPVSAQKAGLGLMGLPQSLKPLKYLDLNAPSPEEWTVYFLKVLSVIPGMSVNHQLANRKVLDESFRFLQTITKPPSNQTVDAALPNVRVI